MFNGLAHFIKGGVIFWFGILTLGRWMGCFSARGWAWNSPSFGRKNPVSMEMLECFIIFLYGITNVFLEHLSNWGGAWIPSDFEHVAISLLFIGGGLVSKISSRHSDHSNFEYSAGSWWNRKHFIASASLRRMGIFKTMSSRSRQIFNPAFVSIPYLL